MILFDHLNSFIAALRAADLPVSSTESLDAMKAVKCIDIADREIFKHALLATLVKHWSHQPAFDALFEVYFALASAHVHAHGMLCVPHEVSVLADKSVLPHNENAELNNADNAGIVGVSNSEDSSYDVMLSCSDEDFSKMLHTALLRNKDMSDMRRALSMIAVSAVCRYAGIKQGRVVGGRYYLNKTLRKLNLEGILEALLSQKQHLDGEVSSGINMSSGANMKGGMSDLDRWLIGEEYRSYIAQLKREVELNIQRSLVADRGVEWMAKIVSKPLPADVDFIHATEQQILSMRRAVYPLVRKLAVRLAQKRICGGQGSLDFRATVRHSLSYGGVLAEPKFLKKRPHKPEIVILADVSGSVASFAQFTLQVVHAMSSQFTKVRSFAFVDKVDEVTGFLAGNVEIETAMKRINAEADVAGAQGHSDYGKAFKMFIEKYSDAIRTQTTVMILGDARNNYHSMSSTVVKAIKSKARNVFWLNPEPRSYWGTGDSVVWQYAPECDGVFEVRNLRQLEACINEIA